MSDLMGTSWKEDSWADNTWAVFSWVGAVLTEMMSRFRARWRGRGYGG